MDKIQLFAAGETLANLAGLHGTYRFEADDGQIQNIPYVCAIVTEDGCGIIVHNKLENLVERIAAYLVYERQMRDHNLSEMLIEFTVTEQKTFEKPLKQEDKARFYEELLQYSENKMPTPFGITFRLEPKGEQFNEGILVQFYKQNV